ncbi:MAG: protein-tyrosine-phosphatase [Alphaproteobacteria bacterium]|jgi:protein-tyrosine phosphatase|nr:protein-tyrosine-phosphatase [Alphaproteobacteria bacterium]
MSLFNRASTLALLFIVSACSAGQESGETEVKESETAPMTEVETVSVSLERSSGRYSLDWSLSDAGTPVDIFVATSPDGAKGEPIGDDITATSFTWTHDDDLTRHYFTLVPENGEPRMVSTRVLPLEGGRNFRDLGGYETTDGQRVKWGTVYRSGVMDGLTDADYDYLSDLGISVVCDFRASDEREEEPTDWRAGDIEYITFPDPSGTEDMSNAFAEVLMDPDVTGAQVRSMFIESYRSMHETYAPAYTEMFDQLANGDLPLTFNCSAGKDRTGVAAALLLSALGVPRETVVADYALSEKVVDFMAEFEVGREEIDPDSPYAFFAQLPPEVIEPLMRTEPAYIEATFEAIEAEHDSVVAFIQSELGVDDTELARMRKRLLN